MHDALEIFLSLRYVRAMFLSNKLIKFMRAILLGVLLSASSASADCTTSNRGMQTMESALIALQDDAGARIELTAFIADDDLERAGGYQFICPEIMARTAILFRFDEPSAGRFHMHNVEAPLDIGFFDAAGVLLQSMRMEIYVDGEEILYGPMQEFHYALEVPPGFFAERELSAGKTRLLIAELP